MSDTSTKARAPSFFDLYRQGAATADEIDDYVGRWHRDPAFAAGDVPLHDFLGLTREEYEVLLFDAEALPEILAARQSCCPLTVLMAARLRELKAADRPEDGTTITLLDNWLADQPAATAD